MPFSFPSHSNFPFSLFCLFLQDRELATTFLLSPKNKKRRPFIIRHKKENSLVPTCAIKASHAYSYSSCSRGFAARAEGGMLARPATRAAPTSLLLRELLAV